MKIIKLTIILAFSLFVSSFCIGQNSTKSYTTTDVQTGVTTEVRETLNAKGDIIYTQITETTRHKHGTGGFTKKITTIANGTKVVSEMGKKVNPETGQMIPISERFILGSAEQRKEQGRVITKNKEQVEQSKASSLKKTLELAQKVHYGINYGLVAYGYEGNYEPELDNFAFAIGGHYHFHNNIPSVYATLTTAYVHMNNDVYQREDRMLQGALDCGMIIRTSDKWSLPYAFVGGGVSIAWNYWGQGNSTAEQKPLSDPLISSGFFGVGGVAQVGFRVPILKNKKITSFVEIWGGVKVYYGELDSRAMANQSFVEQGNKSRVTRIFFVGVRSGLEWHVDDPRDFN